MTGENNGGAVHGVTKIGDTLAKSLAGNASCTAAIILAGMFAFLAYVSFQREAERAEKRAQAAIDIIERCYPNEAHPP